jgi:hypothetical protein
LTAAARIAAALAGYDKAFEQRLADAIITAIGDASRINDCTIIRTGEAAAALTSVLASVLALSPASARSPTAVRKLSESFRKKLMAQVRTAAADPLFADFKARTFHSGDRARGGNA